MRILSRGVLSTGLVLCLCSACTEENSSSSSSSGGSSSSSTGGSSSSSTGGGSSGGTSSSSSSTSGGSSGTTSSSSSSSTGGSSGTASSSSGGSSGGATCPPAPFTLCDGVTAETTARTLNTTPGSGALGIAGLVTLGMTRAQVTAAIPEQERFLDGAPLRAFYCEKRLVISYGDTADGGGVLAGTLSNDDVVVRIHTLAGFAGRTDTDIALGDADTEIGTAYAAETSHAQVLSTVLGGAQELYPARGLAFGINGSSVAWMAVHRGSDGTLTPTPVNARLNLAGNAIGTGQDVKAAFTAGTTFATVKQKLGSLPDAAGTITYNSQQVAYLTYASLGLRVVGTPQGSTLDEATTFQIYITPPFAGFDSTTLGLGSSKAEFDTQFGTPSQQNVNGAIFYKYETGSGLFPPAIGVGYATDDACVERAAVIVLNFVTL